MGLNKCVYLVNGFSSKWVVSVNGFSSKWVVSSTSKNEENETTIVVYLIYIQYFQHSFSLFHIYQQQINSFIELIRWLICAAEKIQFTAKKINLVLKSFNLVTKDFKLLPKRFSLVQKKESKLVGQKNQNSAEKIGNIVKKIQKITNRINWILSKWLWDVITMFIVSTKKPEHVSDMFFSLAYLVDEFTLKEMNSWDQSKISAYCFFGWCKSRELGGRGISRFPCGSGWGLIKL